MKSSGAASESARGGRERVETRVWVGAGALVLAGLAVFVYMRVFKPTIGLGNNDVAGIAYNADILLRGGLPFIDSYELKSPLAFFIVAFFWKVFGRSAEMLHRACDVMILIGATGVWAAARALYSENRRATGVLAAGLATGLYFTGFAQFASNYSSWMVGFYMWCVTAAIYGLQTDRARWHVLTGVFAGLSYLAKAHAVVLGVAVPLMWAWARWRKYKGATWRAWWGWIVGSALAALPSRRR